MSVPKLVDHEQRREQLAAALWRLVMREGIEAVSVRRVAAEAGCSTGSLRHYFETRSELLAFAMELVVERVSARVASPPAGLDRRAIAESALQQVLPVDAERRAEAQVWLAFPALIEGPALPAVLAPAVTTTERQVELLAAHLDHP